MKIIGIILIIPALLLLLSFLLEVLKDIFWKNRGGYYGFNWELLTGLIVIISAIIGLSILLP